jgi:hypothetical protein
MEIRTIEPFLKYFENVRARSCATGKGEEITLALKQAGRR